MPSGHKEKYLSRRLSLDDIEALIMKDGILNNLCLMQLECYNKEGSNVTCFTKQVFCKELT